MQRSTHGATTKKLIMLRLKFYNLSHHHHLSTRGLATYSRDIRQLGSDGKIEAALMSQDLLHKHTVHRLDACRDWMIRKQLNLNHLNFIVLCPLGCSASPSHFTFQPRHAGTICSWHAGGPCAKSYHPASHRYLSRTAYLRDPPGSRWASQWKQRNLSTEMDLARPLVLNNYRQ